MFNKTVYLILSGFLLTYLQLELGNLGWPLPLALMGGLYLTLAFGRDWGIASTLLSGAVIATLYGGNWNLLYIIIYPLTAALVAWWVENHDEDIQPDFWPPGALAGFAGSLPLLLQLFAGWMNGGTAGNLPWVLARMVWSVVLSGGIFVFIIFLGEGLSEFFGLPRFFVRKGGQKR
jgi:hypothetical protein